jgi:hypothetical protein
MNLTWTYTGTTPISGSAALGTFSAMATTNQLTSSNFTALATAASGPLAGTKIANIGMTAVPVPEASALAPVIGLCGCIIFAGFVSAPPSPPRDKLSELPLEEPEHFAGAKARAFG